MIRVLIISAGPGMEEVRSLYGHATDWISNFIKDDKIEINIVHIYKDDNINLSKYDACIITGSSSSVLDNYKWIESLQGIVKDSLKSFKPLLGICFGHQLIAQALGGNVIKNPKGWELGSFKISFNNSRIKNLLFKNIDKDDYFYESHEDVVNRLPNNAIKLASNKMGIQAFAINGLIFGVQFHPEFSYAIMDQYVKVRYEKGIIKKYIKYKKSKTSHMLLINFIEFVKERTHAKTNN